MLNCQAKNMSLHEDLGQIDYLFCDKTGTLTKNELVFKKWSCGGSILEQGIEVETCQEDIERFKNFLRSIVICHDIMIVDTEVDGIQTKQMSGSSVDEMCLLEMVQRR